MQHQHTEEHKKILRDNGKYGSLGGRPRKGFSKKTLRKPYENPISNSESLSSLIQQNLFNLAFTENPNFHAVKYFHKIEREETAKNERLLEKRLDQLIKFNLRDKDGPQWLLDEIKHLEEIMQTV